MINNENVSGPYTDMAQQEVAFTDEQIIVTRTEIPGLPVVQTITTAPKVIPDHEAAEQAVTDLVHKRIIEQINLN